MKARGTWPQKIALFDLTPAQLEELVTSLGEPRYRADQLRGWLYHSLATDFAQMTNLPRALRERLAEVAVIHTLVPVAETVSSDGLARKVLFQLQDGETIESVLMYYNDGAARHLGKRARAKHRVKRAGPARERNTVCASTQVGCAMGCVFCATGQMGFVRNLTAGEIVEQVLYFARQLKEGNGSTQEEATGQRVPQPSSLIPRSSSLTNVVFMGMGEPLVNYDATWQAIETLHDPQGFGLGARRMTLSTVGWVPGIQRLSREKLQVGLAVSLHAPNDDLRNQLVPPSRRYPLDQLMAACRDYVARTGRRVTFEYALIDGVNDSLELARQLGDLLDGLLCHVNLIPLNPTEGYPHGPSPYERTLAFQQELERRGIPTTLRVRRGLDIQAGCGQLRSRYRMQDAR
ncbi:MAG: 23S rRNA (adenine(2503)-C(2))-methyltransferase RlmN [Anaerolineae bacterium]